MKPKARLSDLALALDFADAGEHTTRFDREQAKIVSVEDYIMSRIEDGESFEDDELADWQQEEVAIAQAILDDDRSRFINPPAWDTSDRFECMREFAEQWPDKSVAGNLLDQLGGRGSFGRFREAVFEHRIEDEWSTFQDQKQKEVLIEWCRENDAEFEDDLHIGPSKHATSDRAHLLGAAKWFVGEAAKLEEVERIALVGSLCTDQRKPRDMDLLVTISPGSSLTRIAKLKRKLQGRISRSSMGSDVFIAENGRYIGRACQYRDSWPRVECSKSRLRCAEGRPGLCDTSANFSLDQKVVDRPSVILWPEAKEYTEVPADVHEFVSGLSTVSNPA